MLILIEMFTSKTQNANEISNGIIWEGLPKIWHCGLQKLEFDVYDDVVGFLNMERKPPRIFLSSEVVTWCIYKDCV